MAEQNFDAIIIGAGAAGLYCAAMAGQRGRRIMIIDHSDEPGKKILISGGGRCNFTNMHTSADRYISANPHFAKSALGRHGPQAFIDLVDAHGIAWHEKTLGQLFCDGSAKQIVAMLLAECAKAAASGGEVTHCYGAPVDAVTHADGVYRVTVGGRIATAPRLVVASGGLSIPKLGASGFAYDLARQFGLKVVEPRPALVPLTLGGDETLFRELSGVAAPVEARAGFAIDKKGGEKKGGDKKDGAKARAKFREAALFTHRGLSGPAILQASSYWRNGEKVAIDFLPDLGGDWLVEAKAARPLSTMRAVLAQHLPDRLAEVLADRLGCTGELGAQGDKALRAAAANLSNWAFHPNGSEGFAKAEVTIGGISTAELSSQSLEARRMPGFHAIGESIDVTGWLGGYNFQWAWASGWAVAQAL